MNQDETTLEELRREIDQINRGILDLVQSRGEVVLQIGLLKKAMGLQGFDPGREEQMLDGLTRNIGGPYPMEDVREIFRAIFRASLRLQNRQIAPIRPGTNGNSLGNGSGETFTHH